MSQDEVPDGQPRKRIKVEHEPAEQKHQDSSNGFSSKELARNQLDQEAQRGITVFASAGESFRCIVKQRFTDFLVNEIQTSGEVVHLDKSALTEADVDTSDNEHIKIEHKAPNRDGQNLVGPAEHGKQDSAQPRSQNAGTDRASKINAPSQTAAAKSATADDTAASPSHNATREFTTEETAKITAIFGEKTTSAMCSLYNKIQAHPDKKAGAFAVLKSDPITDKQQRTAAHISVREVFRSALDTSTESDNTITIRASGKGSAGRNPEAGHDRITASKDRGRINWDELGGQYLHFTVYKENKDTMEIINFMSSKLRVHAKNISMSGTKDRRGVTVQRLSAFRMLEDRLKNLNRMLKQARVGGFCYQPQGLRMGDLAGNEFLLTLRDCRFEGDELLSLEQRVRKMDEIAERSVANLRARGYINYYGLQRFGAFAVGTHDIGRMMLQGDLKGAVAGILTYTDAALAAAKDSSDTSKIPTDDKLRAEAIHEWQTTRGLQGVHEKLPRRFQAEHAIIRYLSSTAKRMGQASSEDWQGALMSINRSLRIMYVHAYQSLVFNHVAAKRIELSPDSVIEGDLVIIDKAAETAAPLEDVDDQGEVIIRPAPDDSSTRVEDEFERARPLSKAEAESGRYSLADVVLALPGFDVVYPSNAIGQYYKEYMARDNLDPDNMRRHWKEISMSGGYRKLVSRPLQVSCGVRTYQQNDQQLVQADLERLIAESKKPESGSSVDAATTQQTAQNDKVALILKMQLGSSQYATMALRELTKGGALAFRPDFQGDR